MVGGGRPRRFFEASSRARGGRRHSVRMRVFGRRGPKRWKAERGSQKLLEGDDWRRNTREPLRDRWSGAGLEERPRPQTRTHRWGGDKKKQKETKKNRTFTLKLQETRREGPLFAAVSEDGCSRRREKHKYARRTQIWKNGVKTIRVCSRCQCLGLSRGV